jgi:DNA-binding CsgD family transcriptional regulator
VSDPSRKRWDRMTDRLADAGEPRPPFPTIVTDVIWLVFRVDPKKISPYVPAELAISLDLIGVLGMCAATDGSAIAPFVRGFGGVAIEGHDAPDTKEAVYIAGDVVTPGAAEIMQEFYVRDAQAGEPRIWWEGDLLHGAMATGGEDWLHVVIRPSGPEVSGVTGLDAYLGMTGKGLTRHIVSYLGAMAPAEVVSFSVSENAPPVFAALRPTEIILGIWARELHATWGEPHPVPDGALLAPPLVSKGPRDPVDLLRSLGLTPAEARLAAKIGQGCSARSAAAELGISQHTARSTLKQVYGKLGIRKQAELGGLIARVQFG